ncbi:MAG: LysR family transcriptional regulator [Anaerovoracaceae bacterium]
MELLQLKYFLYLARNEHVSRTAEQLHISQPSLSSTIKRLEQELGVPLFEKKGRNIVLSEYGKIYLNYVESAFALLENGERALRTKKGDDDRHLVLGILSPYIWQDLLHAFSDAYPQISVDRHSLEGNEYIRSLFEGKIDLYIGAITQREMTGLEYRILYEDDMVLLVNKKNSLSEKKEIDLRDCGDVNFINLGDETSLQQFLTELYREAGLSPRVIMKCDYTLRDEMVIENRGVSLTTKTSALRLESDQVVPVDITFPKRKRILGLVWRKNLHFTQAMCDFYDFCIRWFSS